ncbi:MAG: MT-A70 family methyltransferase, partial [Rhodospirillaceae bacterium]|nr:MT-A70 family methyltransferase [Rhodospirillaceae bacterium]
MLGPDDPEFEREALERFRAARRHAVEGIFVMGETLLEVRQRLKHGRWLEWLGEVGASERSAQKLMAIAQDFKLLDWRGDAGRARLLPPAQETLYQLATLNDRDFDALAGADKIHPEMRRGEIRPALAAIAHGAATGGEAPSLAALPAGVSRAILADPPWRFETHGPDGRGRAPDKHYPTMALEDIEMLPVMSLAADAAALFLWVTADMLHHAPRIM